jgi:hypothetical protein
MRLIWGDLLTWMRRAVTSQMIAWTLVLAGIAGLIAWLTDIQPGPASEWFAGVGAIFAAGVALNIATRDRRDRLQEQDDMFLTEMRMLRITPRPTTDQHTWSAKIENYGRWPIVRLAVVEARINTPRDVFSLIWSIEPGAAIKKEWIEPQEIPIAPTVNQPGSSELEFKFKLRNSAGEPWCHPADTAQLPMVIIKIYCIGPDGQEWVLHNHSDPVRKSGIPNPSPPLRALREIKAQGSRHIKTIGTKRFWICVGFGVGGAKRFDRLAEQQSALTDSGQAEGFEPPGV